MPTQVYISSHTYKYIVHVYYNYAILEDHMSFSPSFIKLIMITQGKHDYQYWYKYFLFKAYTLAILNIVILVYFNTKMYRHSSQIVKTQLLAINPQHLLLIMFPTHTTI